MIRKTYRAGLAAAALVLAAGVAVGSPVKLDGENAATVREDGVNAAALPAPAPAAAAPAATGPAGTVATASAEAKAI
jgi:hypothetical protein